MVTFLACAHLPGCSSHIAQRILSSAWTPRTVDNVASDRTRKRVHLSIRWYSATSVEANTSRTTRLSALQVPGPCSSAHTLASSRGRWIPVRRAQKHVDMDLLGTIPAHIPSPATGPGRFASLSRLASPVLSTFSNLSLLVSSGSARLASGICQGDGTFHRQQYACQHAHTEIPGNTQAPYHAAGYAPWGESASCSLCRTSLWEMCPYTTSVRAE
jgi:hypothetical protein